MRLLNIVALGLLICFTFSCKEVKKEAEKEIEEIQPAAKEVNVEKIAFSMQAKSGSDVAGTVSFTEENGTVSMLAELSGLSPGEHAIHLHEKADCTSDDGKSTGGHWNPTAEPHGKWGAQEGYHRGDIGNFTADEQGNATVEFSTNLWCLGCEDETKNILGKAVIVHQGVDDFTSQPSGAAGARVSCTGIIE
ncbi:MAG: superoxide dismutase family protein [Flavobacteriaceae bacterium]